MTRLLSTVALVLLLAGQAWAEWYAFNPPGAIDGQGILADVVSRCDEQGRRTAYEPDRVTYCHEATHMLNSRIRNSLAGTGKVNAFYVGEGRCCVLPEPRVTLAHVARYVAPEYRNSTYQLYLQQQRQHWDNEPLYVLDEWSAYLNGSQAANELQCDEHGSHDRCQWFCHFADCLVLAVREYDPQYAELDELVAFVEWQQQRAQQLTQQPEPAGSAAVESANVPSRLIDMPRQYRERNYDGSCGYIATANCLRFCGLWSEAYEFRRRNRGPSSDRSISYGLRQLRIRHLVGRNGDEKLLREAIASGRGSAVTWGGMHCVNLVGIEGDNAVLMGNGPQGVREFHREPWHDFMANHRRSGGWSIVILDGEPSQPVTE